MILRKRQLLEKTPVWGDRRDVLMFQNEGGYYTPPQNGDIVETSCVEDSKAHLSGVNSEREQNEIPLVSTEVDIGEELHEPIGTAC